MMLAVLPHTDRSLAATPRRIPSLDGLRAISIGFVLLGHLAGVPGPFPPNIFTEDLANTGVRVFFVISGFLITTLLMKEYAAHGAISLRGFYLRRCLRIVPAFVSFLVVLLLLIAAGVFDVSARDLLAAATYTSNFFHVKNALVGHIWSLSVEEQFYLLWPPIIVFAGWRRAGRIAIATVLLAPVVRLFYIWVGWRNFGQFQLLADAIAVGCLLALHRERLQSSAFVARMVRWRGFVPIAVVLIFVLKSYHAGRPMAIFESLINIAIALLIYRYVHRPEGGVARFLNSSPLVYVGTLSYSLYVWQQLFLQSHSTYMWNSFPVNLFFTACAAVVSYHVIELPFLRLKDSGRLRQTASRPVAVVPAGAL